MHVHSLVRVRGSAPVHGYICGKMPSQYALQMCVCISVRQISRKNCVSEGKSNIVLQGSDSHEINLLSSGAAATDDRRGSTIPPARCGLRDIWPFTEPADTNRIWCGRQMKATSGEMRAAPPAGESLTGGGMDFPLCLKT